ncbi:hypothetical protein [Candidatus Pollutiaquabacter sp.]|uniref:hypothetical protein n=1 Tax=Candidatus Pollutiaquabacter sp. TaxID=3416354 RepID=UPI003CB47E3C|nr:hypothetical protein [Bacteroidota bacterium]
MTAKTRLISLQATAFAMTLWCLPSAFFPFGSRPLFQGRRSWHIGSVEQDCFHLLIAWDVPLSFPWLIGGVFKKAPFRHNRGELSTIIELSRVLSYNEHHRCGNESYSLTDCIRSEILFELRIGGRSLFNGLVYCLNTLFQPLNVLFQILDNQVIVDHNDELRAALEAIDILGMLLHQRGAVGDQLCELKDGFLRDHKSAELADRWIKGVNADSLCIRRSLFHQVTPRDCWISLAGITDSPSLS